MSCNIQLRHELCPTGGATQTIFPAAEELLNDSDHQGALEFVSARKNMGKYRSMMDFLFCEIFIEHRPGAFAYYRDEGPQLRFLITEKQRAFFDQLLVKALHIAYAAYCEQREQNWDSFRRQVLKRTA